MQTTSNRLLGLAYKWLLPLALVAAIGVAAVSVISADSDDGEDECKPGRGAGRFAALAELVGTDVEGLKTGLGEGMTLAEIAAQNGIEAQTVIDALIEKAHSRIDAAVEADKLTQEEGEAKKSSAATRIENMVNNGFDQQNFRGWGKGRWRGHGGDLGGDVESG